MSVFLFASVLVFTIALFVAVGAIGLTIIEQAESMARALAGRHYRMPVPQRRTAHVRGTPTAANPDITVSFRQLAKPLMKLRAAA